NYPLPADADPKELIKVPQNAQYFAAIGAVEFGKSEEESVGVYKGFSDLDHYINYGRLEEKKKAGGKGLSDGQDDLEPFKERYKRAKFVAATFKPGQIVEGFLGLDGGSTSTKTVLIDKDRNVLVKTYQLSKGNPIEDTKEVFEKL